MTKAKYSKSTGGVYLASAYETFPADALDIPDAIYKKFTDGEIASFDVVDGNVAAFLPPAPTLAELKIAKKAEITQAFNATMQQVVGGTPGYEINSWSEQKAEALAFSANALSVTPLIDSMATARGVPKATLAARIIAKAVFFAGISGQLIGKRQGLEGSIDTATSKTALAAIIW